MNLAKREGVDIRPTLLRVLTDLYVQTPGHSAEEQQHYVELASRLIGQVDDATRAVVRARLAAYPDAPAEVRALLGLAEPPASLNAPNPEPVAQTDPRQGRTTVERHDTKLTMQPSDAASIDEMFTRATPAERIQILRNLESSPLRPAARIEPRRAGRAVAALERAAFARDQTAFAAELSDILLLPASSGERIVADASGEPLACAAKALAMPSDVFQRVLLFLKPEWGASVISVFRLARLYDSLSEHAALIMLSVWRGAMLAHMRAKYRPTLHDDERRRARAAPSAVQPAGAAGSAKPLPGRQTRGA
ncbi:DUF2336 domain-containing protein [Bradyrhizobium sp. LHD-71]|nr:DUF2336 domain-containing protein [Bradyrhizobium sp. LHD-71]MDQ8728563.1 DUF2336 domain-containing protein [Bradyrhizobium sp. LHD-71]